MTDIIDRFNELANKFKNSSANPNVVIPDNIKLKFYAYYKQVTIGDCNTECPEMFQFQNNQSQGIQIEYKFQKSISKPKTIFFISSAS